ncbi:PIG-L family deacetylase [Acidiferrimicrobium sp. IK]|uniref:PIG-L deacetylase family protein n=1 Tax=Acidiferrimicrobium sp. IK TaxID=2871700 RepID=UPI0021CB26E1|nr:PIG-L deacetylase family protein [Acidiferrimicrobium sp. IK]MCU4183705.1 PIG-L family deacetylase [Acidiferrimicrobium sp. IK]
MPVVEHTVPATVLAVYAHPDDPDVSAGGTLAAWAAAGARIEVCICAEGDKGSTDPATDPAELVVRRREEVAAAGRVLGVAEHHWLGFLDGELDDGPELRGRLVELVRRVRPDLVVGPDPTAVFFGASYVNHRDHRAVGWALLDAVAPAAANPHYFPGSGPAHAVTSLWLSGTLHPDVWVDISATVDRKAEAVGCHVSQTGEPGEWLRTVVGERAEEAGRQAGVTHAESFRRVDLL